MKTCKRFILINLLIFILTGSANSYDLANIKIEDAKAVFSTVRPDVGTIYMKIENEGKTEDALIEVTVDIKNVIAELHDVKNNEMIKVEKITIPAKSSVTFKRGGLHIMLLNLPLEVKENDEFTATLKFERAGEKKIKIRFSSSKHDMMHKH